MDAHRHKTLKKLNTIGETAVADNGVAQNAVAQNAVAENAVAENAVAENPASQPTTSFKNLLEDSAREAYTRPWHRLERGLRLNRIRIFIEDIAPQYQMTKQDKDDFFLFLQKALDKKLLNTLKVVIYDSDETQRITSIRGLEIKRNPEGALKWVFSTKKPKADGTRKKKRDEIPCVSIPLKVATATATATP